MKRNILLVEPDYKSLYPPLGLLKISTYHKQKGDHVNYVQGRAITNKQYREIYITTLFTYFAKEVIDTIRFYKSFYPKAKIRVGGILASLMPDYIKEQTGIYPHIGLFEPAENRSPDYSLVPTFKHSITFTTRGCIKNCKYCAVKKHEPKYILKKHWLKNFASAS